MKKKLELNADYQPKEFVFKDKAKVNEIIARYPKGRQQSATMPLLDLAQRQVGEEGAKANPPYGGWIPRAAMDEVARIVDVPPMRVYEVATFYSMYNLAPVGKYLLQVCTTTPCWLCGSSKVVDAIEKNLGIHMGESTKDGMFSTMEVECLGACANAPMIQVNDDFYEDLTEETMTSLLENLKKDVVPAPGPQNGRNKAEALGGSNTLKRA
ncbi:MAG: NADH-quinone oxidoreductase subunit NuoE [Micavibrio aeruginosavorus]|uniref:NADH-quinone oxidoreductase subunit NuoE n=1 Tax=Micavibrio aeruginosavorus TaxID=349221 RepID=A0A2W5MUI7_9BACT|nr:MAG: NADH-quinone oxidoreductase subunit NuoE [Micavibrio aeruginosavorus]